jgi:hypothetical protein
MRALPVDPPAPACTGAAAEVSSAVVLDVDPLLAAHLDASPDLGDALQMVCRAQLGLMTREGVLAVDEDVIAFVRKDVIDGVVEQRWPRGRVHAFERGERFGRPTVTLLIGDDEIEFEDISGDIDALEQALTAAADSPDPEAPAAPSVGAEDGGELLAAQAMLSAAVAAPARRLVWLINARKTALQLAAQQAERADQREAAARRHRAAVAERMSVRQPSVSPPDRAALPAKRLNGALIAFLIVAAVVVVGIAVTQAATIDQPAARVRRPSPAAGVAPEERPYVVKKEKVERPVQPPSPPGAPHGLKDLVFGEPRPASLKKIQTLGSTRLLPPSVVDPPVVLDLSDPSSLLTPVPKAAAQTVPGGHLELTTTVGGVPAVCELWFAFENKLSRMRCVLDPMPPAKHRAVEVSLIEALTRHYGPPDQAPADPKQRFGDVPGLEGMAAMMDAFRDARWRWADDEASLDVHAKLTDLGPEVDLKPNPGTSRIELDNIATTHHRLLQQLKGIADEQRKRLQAEAAAKANVELQRVREGNAETLQKMTDDL